MARNLDDNSVPKHRPKSIMEPGSGFLGGGVKVILPKVHRKECQKLRFPVNVHLLLAPVIVFCRSVWLSNVKPKDKHSSTVCLFWRTAFFPFFRWQLFTKKCYQNLYSPSAHLIRGRHVLATNHLRLL